MRALADMVYQSDGLNVSTCNTQILVLGWNINQKIFDIGLHYLCVNPSGVSVSARTNHDGVQGSMRSRGLDLLVVTEHKILGDLDQNPAQDQDAVD